MSSSNVLADAQKALSNAKGLTKSIEGTETSSLTSKPKPTPHEYSAAPYSMVQKAKNAIKNNIAGAGAGSDAAAGIKARQENIKQYNEATKNQ